MSRVGNVYRDGRVHVHSEMCSTCVFRRGNLMSLAPGGLRKIIDGNLELGTPLICHQTLAYHPKGGEESVCRGFFERYPTPLLELAEGMGIIQWTDPS